MASDLSLYLHIPFCDTKCAYCDFNSYAGMESLIEPYTRALVQEARLWAPHCDTSTVSTVFFGGGTPSLLPLPQMRSVIDALRGSYSLAADLELSLEANPGTISEQHLRGLREIGFERISLGVQSFDDAELKALDRIHTAAEAIAGFEAARAAGFENVNLDLIFGLAGQILAGWRRNLETVLLLRPEHLSLYALTVEEGTTLAHQVAQGLAPEPDPDLQADMYDLARALLGDAGYEQYEISNWAQPGRACRHNLTYWRNGCWLGLGAGAHSSLPGLRFSTALSPRGYIHRVEQATTQLRATDRNASLATLLDSMPQVVWREAITPAMAMSDTAILGLRLREGVSMSDFHARHGHDLFEVHGDALREFLELGLLTLDGDRLRLTDQALLVANEVFARLLPEP